jgi:riboflavin-specific deaminase-like protein
LGESAARTGVTTGRATASLARPTVTIKIAQTLDGRIATLTGQSQWITCEPARALAHELRATHDAVLVGIGTVLFDNPRLTVRMVDGPNPLRVVADTRLRIPLDANLLTDAPERTVCVTGPDADPSRVVAVRSTGARVLLGQVRDGRLDLAAMLEQLHALGIRSLMVEGGSGIITSLLRERLIDRLVVCIAPKLIGAGLEAIGDLGIRELSDALTFRDTTIRQLGSDIVFDGVVDRPSANGDARHARP